MVRRMAKGVASAGQTKSITLIRQTYARTGSVRKSERKPISPRKRKPRNFLYPPKTSLIRVSMWDNINDVGEPTSIRENNMKETLKYGVGFFLIVITFATFALAQSFPWDTFKPRTVKEVQALTTKAFGPDDSSYLATNFLESRAEVIFMGKSRPINAAHKDFIKIRASMLAEDKNYSNLYQHEYLYKEGDDEYWIATQEPVTKYFDKELKPGDKMTIFFISIGAYNKQFMEAMKAHAPEKDFDCVLLVEEYQLPKPTQPPATKAN